ncbi:transposase-like protein [Corynebacterium diphtheriae DSM 43988]|nr:transposase-like protein [Corynebacterium diphtheriae DSM 43988]
MPQDFGCCGYCCWGSGLGFDPYIPEGLATEGRSGSTEPLNGGISKDFSRYFTPNRFQTGRLSRFGVKCRLFGGERGWRAHQRQPIPPTPAKASQAMVVENVLLRVVPRPNSRRTNQYTLKPEEPLR